MYYVIESKCESGFLYCDITKVKYELGAVYTVCGYTSRVYDLLEFEDHSKAIKYKLELSKLFKQINVEKDKNFIPRSKRNHHGS